MPELQSPPYTNREKPARRRKLQRGDSPLKGEMMDHNPAVEICQDGTAIFVDGEQEIAFGRQIQAVDVGAMRKREGIGRVALRKVSISIPCQVGAQRRT